jgi:hypothetical protein
MIESVAQLLEELRIKELEALQRFGDVGHQGMIGSMYEGLTREILQGALFNQLDLRVVTGKVRLAEGVYSRQMDAMVVVGDGEQMPHTEYWIYPPERVLAVIEVKKTLYASALDDAYQNLASVRADTYMQRIPRDAFYSAFRMVAQMDIPSDGLLARLPIQQEMIAHALMWDAALPVRIVIGYDGYRSEYTLREGFIDYLERAAEQGPRAGYGPANFPSVILCGRNALVKLNALPYAAQTTEPEHWLVYGSIADQASIVLLEVLWTRLLGLGLVTYDVFGDDLTSETLHPLLQGRVEQHGEVGGWRYRAIHMSASELAATPARDTWAPVRLSNAEAVLITQLCAEGELDTATSPFWRSFAEDLGEGLDGALEHLRFNGLAALGPDGVIRLLTHGCQVACLPDFGWVAAENESGRFTRWMGRHLTG